MHLDRELMASDAQAITVTANSTDVIDLYNTVDVGRASIPMRCRVQVDTAFTAGGAATLQAQLVLSAAAALSAPEVLFDTTAIGKATLVAGYIMMDIVLPQTDLQYLGWIYTVAAGPMTAGALSAFLVTDTETPQARRVLGNTGLS